MGGIASPVVHPVSRSISTPIFSDMYADGSDDNVLTDENGAAITDLPGGDTIETIS